MLQIGQERAKEFGQDQVKFEFCDITKAEFETESFDVIYSRDTFIHIGEKEKLFSNFLECVKLLKLNPGQKVLDVGCGIGGSAFHMAKNYQVNVHGVDLSKNMLQIGQERAKEFGQDQVKFEFCDITKAEFETESFDVIYSRDTFIHIGEKEKLFSNFLKWLKPGGQLLITDYCHGEGELSQEFQDYVKQRCYSLTTVSNYGKILEKVGFAEVKAEDNSNRFIEVLNTEMQRFENEKEDFIKEFSESDYNSIIGAGQTK